MTKFISGEINLGLLGKVTISIWPNDRKEKPNQPDYRITAKIGEDWQNVGAGWKKESKDKGSDPLSKDAEAFMGEYQNRGTEVVYVEN